MPFDVIDNDFTGSFCIGFLVDTSLTNTAPLAYFHDITSAILGNITVEGGAPGSVILNIKGTEVVFTVETLGFKRFQLCREGNEMTLYDGCTAVEPSQPFPSEFDPDFQDTDFVGLLRDLTGSQSIFAVILLYSFFLTASLLYKYIYFSSLQNSVAEFYFLSCTGPGVTQEGMAQVQCDSSPIDCDDPFVALESAADQYVASLNADSPTVSDITIAQDFSIIWQSALTMIYI